MLYVIRFFFQVINLNNLSCQTVVFDCCHSGSGTRVVISNYESTRLRREIILDQSISDDLDRDVWIEASLNPRAAVIAPGFLRSGSRSHVLLAACGAGEIAQEEKGRGIFTRALLETLKGAGADKITYGDLMQRIPDLPG